MNTKRLYIDGKPTKYLINELGQIYSEHTNKFLKPYPNPQGYMLVDIHGDGINRTFQVHRLVALTFIPNPDKLETVNHKDGNKKNNAVTNLEWMTRLDNVRHAWDTGLAKPRYGTDNPANVYTEEQIHAVCQLIEVGELSNVRIAKLCNVNVTLIRDIKFRNKWTRISKLYDIPSIEGSGYKELRKSIFEAMDAELNDDEIMDVLELPEKLRHYIHFLRRIHSKRSLNDYC